MKTFFKFVLLLKKINFFKLRKLIKNRYIVKKLKKKFAVVHQKKAKKKRDILP